MAILILTNYRLNSPFINLKNIISTNSLEIPSGNGFYRWKMNSIITTWSVSIQSGRTMKNA